jgi:hypothetical protein
MEEAESRILHSEGNTDVTYDETGSWIITGGGEGDIRLLESFDGDDVTAQTGAGMVHALACRVRGKLRSTHKQAVSSSHYYSSI